MNRSSFFVVVVVSLLCLSGCDSFQSRDGCFNAATSVGIISVSFVDGKSNTFEWNPGVGGSFTASGRGEVLPELSGLTVRLKDRPVEYSLGQDALGKIRRQCKGKAYLTIFDEGLAVVPPTLSKQLSRTQSTDEFMAYLYANKAACLAFTREILDGY
jgi:hypothetical protein